MNCFLLFGSRPCRPVTTLNKTSLMFLRLDVFSSLLGSNPPDLSTKFTFKPVIHCRRAATMQSFFATAMYSVCWFLDGPDGEDAYFVRARRRQR